MIVKNGGQVEFLTKQAKLCDISYPILIRTLCMKISVQKIWCNSSDIALIGAILFHSH